MRDLATVFKALSDETRLELLALLLHAGELCVCDCVEALGISQSKASRHLRYLLHAGLVRDRREGLWVHYRVPDDLSAERGRIVAALRELVRGPRSEAALAGLRAWWERKAVEGPGCPAPPVREHEEEAE